MSESSWGESEGLPPPKKRVPTWLWFCGSGCLLAVILAIVAGGWIVSLVKDSMNPEKQWPHVAEILPFDQRPPEMTPVWGSTLGVDIFVLKDTRGFMFILMSPHTTDFGPVREQYMNASEGRSLIGAGEREDAKAGQVQVQGRALEVVRFYQRNRQSETKAEAGQPDIQSGPSMMVDLTQPSDTRLVLLQILRLGGNDPISDEEVQNLLKPFHVGPVR